MTDSKKEETPGPGHNSKNGEVSGARLKSFIERIEKLEEEKKALAEDIKDVFGEAKATGFEPKIMKKIIRLKKVNKEKHREESELTKLYAAAIGYDLDFFTA